MILADKIIRLRKKNGWSQEELAEKMNVSRQAVSKWEGAQSVPDLEKILRLSELFGVTTDYLLKDDIEDEEFTDDVAISSIKRVSLEDANEYIEQRKTASLYIAIATFLCIISPIPILILSVASEVPTFSISENLASAIGLIMLFIIVTIAVGIFVFCGLKNSPYQFLEYEPFEVEYGVTDMVKEKQKAYRNTYVKFNVIGTCICVLSPVALFLGVFTEKVFLIILMLSIMIFIVGIGVMFFIIAGIRWASMQKLLKEGDFSVKSKKEGKIKSAITDAYWLIVTAIYLAWSFITHDWHISWIIWPIAGVIFGLVAVICNLFVKND